MGSGQLTPAECASAAVNAAANARAFEGLAYRGMSSPGWRLSVNIRAGRDLEPLYGTTLCVQH